MRISHAQILNKLSQSGKNKSNFSLIFIAAYHYYRIDCIFQIFREAGGVAEIDWCVPGEDAAMETLLDSKEGFLTKRIKGYHSDRNDPSKPRGLSGLSPYLHFGQISAQRCALEARARRNISPQVINISDWFYDMSRYVSVSIHLVLRLCSNTS